jgi:glycerophosphoryl diester phosphodiesterase
MRICRKHWLITRPIAHRGLHSEDKGIPENSLLSFTESIKRGYPIEIDLRITSKGEVVVFHDEDLTRMTGQSGNIKSLEYSDFSELRLLGSEQKIPLLSEVLSLVNGQVPILIEIKNSIHTQELPIIISILQNYPYEFAVQSFDPFILNWFRINHPHIIRGQLSCSFEKENLPLYKKFILKYLMLNYLSKPDFIAYNIDDMPNIATFFVKKLGGVDIL